MVTIEPRTLRSGFSAARANKNAAVKLVSSTRCHSESVRPAERFADHYAGIGDDAVEAVEALNKRVDRVGNGFRVAHIAFDGDTPRSRG
jgi:hypothetical protein